MENCIFCKIIKRQAKAYIIDESDHVIVILSLENHPLIITKKHIENIYSMDEKSAEEVMKEAVKISKAVKKALKADGISLVQSNEKAANQEVFHFHLHIKPRWHKDKIRFEWNFTEVEKDKREKTLKEIKKHLDSDS